MSMQGFPDSVRAFVDREHWTIAKTMPDWPHEYLVRERVDERLFVRLVEHIRAQGYEGHFYQRTIVYYEEARQVYWTMGAPLAETTIVNRCGREDTYEWRRSAGTLPSWLSLRREEQEMDGLAFERDIRSTEPNESGYRKARFRAGWKKAVAGEHYGKETLKELTWDNLGHRLGRLFPDATSSRIDELYDWCVRQQGNGGAE